VEWCHLYVGSWCGLRGSVNRERDCTLGSFSCPRLGLACGSGVGECSMNLLE
jgi:hypothetical protein